MNTRKFKSTELKTPPEGVFQEGSTSPIDSETHTINSSKDMTRTAFDAVFKDRPNYFKPRNEK